MGISAGTVPACPNSTGRMDPGMNTNIETEYMKGEYVRISIMNIAVIYKNANF